MAKARRGGFKPPANYEPGRRPKSRSRFAGEQRASKDRTSKNHAAKERTPNTRVPKDPAAQQQSKDPAAQQQSNRTQQQPKRTPRQPNRTQQRPRIDLPSARRTTAADAAGVTFEDLGLGANLVRVLAELGADAPFPIQVATIPDALAGRNVLGRARTGSGKTIAFGAAVVERLLRLRADGAIKRPVAPKAARGTRSVPRATRNPTALILAPTRELALQIDRTVQPLARAVGLYTAQFVGGVPIDPQIHALRRGVDIVIGTPGRVQDLINRGKLELRDVQVTVLDEADHMCELGFLEPVQRVLRNTARHGQRLLFSATLDEEVTELVAEFLPRPELHEAEERASGRVTHTVLVALREHKLEVLRELLTRRGRILVFCRTRAHAEQLTETAREWGASAVSLHGNLSQARRERNLEKFATGKTRVLIATDVAARGIHVDSVDLVVQADGPADAKTYLHRAGRTGRAGSDGAVVTVIPRTRQKITRTLLDEAKVAADWRYVPETNGKN